MNWGCITEGHLCGDMVIEPVGSAPVKSVEHTGIQKHNQG